MLEVDRRIFGEYLRYLHVQYREKHSKIASSPRPNLDLGIIAERAGMSRSTLVNLRDGNKDKPEGAQFVFSETTIKKIDELVDCYLRERDEVTEVLDYDEWLQKRPNNVAAGQTVSATEEKTAVSDNAEEARTEVINESARLPRSRRFWWLGGGLIVALVAAAVVLRTTCFLPGLCAPSNIDFWGIQTDYFMRVNHNGYAMQEKFSGPRIVRLREPIIYFETDHRIGFVDSSITFINRTDDTVIEPPHRFKADVKDYRQPYVNDQIVSAIFDFEVVECFAVHLENEGVWVKEFRVKQPDGARLRDLVTQERYEDFKLVNVFNPDPVFSRSKLECPSDIQTDALYREFEESGAGEPLVDIVSLYPDIHNDPPTPDDIALEEEDITFDGSWWGGAVRLKATISADLPAGTEFHVSQDGENFGWGLAVSNMKPQDQFLVRLSNQSWPEDAGPFDFTDLARAAATVVVETEFGKNSETVIRCEPGSCEIANYAFCNGNWQNLSLGRQPGEYEAVVDFTDCDTSNIGSICLSTPIDLFPIAPSQSVFAALQSVTGDAYEFEFFARPLIGHFQQGAPFVPLISLTKDAPPTFALLSVHGFAGTNEVRYTMAIAAKGCSVGRGGLAEAFRAIYYDVDGKGYVRGDLRGFWIPEPSRDFIEIVLEGKDGSRYGPFQYAFPSEEIIGSSIAPIERASSFECRRKLSNRFDAKSWFYYCYAPSTSQSIFEWADVLEVQIGSSPDDLSEVMKVDLTNREIVELNAQTRQGAVPPVFEYRPSNDQDDVYFSIVYKDGTSTLVQRLELPEPLQ